MTMKAGFRAEAVYGTSVLAAGADDYVYAFGDYLAKHEIPIPWHEIPMLPVYRSGNTAPQNLVEGAKDVTFKIAFTMVSADMLKYVLGTVASGHTFTNSSTLPSFTTYIETDWDDVIVITGCVVKGFDFYADKLMPTVIELTILGSEVAERVKLVPTAGSSPRYPTGLGLTECWGWGNNNTLTLDTADIIGDGGEIDRVHLHVENILKTRTSDKVVQVKKVGVGVELDFDIPAKDTTNQLLRAVRDEETNDFYYKWLRGVYTMELWVNNCKFRKMNSSQSIGQGGPPVYTIAGQAVYDSTNTGFEDAVKYKVVDGVTYS